jgi:hypothetical protein
LIGHSARSTQRHDRVRAMARVASRRARPCPRTWIRQRNAEHAARHRMPGRRSVLSIGMRGPTTAAARGDALRARAVIDAGAGRRLRYTSLIEATVSIPHCRSRPSREIAPADRRVAAIANRGIRELVRGRPDALVSERSGA